MSMSVSLHRALIGIALGALWLVSCAPQVTPTPEPTATRAPATPRTLPVLPSPEVVVPTFPPRSGTPASAAATTAPSSSDELALVRAFDGSAAYEHTRVLTSKAMAGRKAGAAGGDLAAEYIAGRFKAAGLKPIGDGGTYFQNFMLPFVDLADAPALALLGDGGAVKQSFVPRVDFRESGQWMTASAQAEGSVIFLGRGTERDIRLASDLNGKIALVFQPPNQRVSDWAANLFRNGVAGLLVITNSPDNLAFKSSYIAGSGLPNETHPLLVVSNTAAQIMMGSAGRLSELEERASREGVAIATSARVRMSLKVDIKDAPTKNVVAALPGSDPSLSAEVLIVGGHYDHVGVDPGGLLFQGANDNASGAAVVVALAEQFVQAGIKPKRTIVFAAWSAEESGLIGSKYYVDHPLFPLTQTKGYINLDVVGAGLGDGLNITEDSPALADQAKSAARDLGVKTGREQVSGGSDHESFLKRGVPAIFFIWQRYGDIHMPNDTFDQIDVAKLKQTGQVAMLLLLRLAGT
ncbi:MAG: M20/M25/M40 family metallo-hydrolase [Chloroflexi bacterium]|nr:M20/M25/M40 family metallo-hydrolase [Chloroflexota bacterium]